MGKKSKKVNTQASKNQNVEVFVQHGGFQCPHISKLTWLRSFGGDHSSKIIRLIASVDFVAHLEAPWAYFGIIVGLAFGHLGQYVSI